MVTSTAPRPKALHSSPHLVPVLECVITERLSNAQLREYHTCAAIQAAKVGLRTMGITSAVPGISGALSASNVKTSFHALRAPSVTPIDYLHRLVRHSHCSRSVFVTALYYLDIIAAKRPELAINALNIHRLLLTATLLATKYLDDILYDNSHFAFVGGLDVTEINHLELVGLKILDFKLFISPADFAAYEAKLIKSVLINRKNRPIFHNLVAHTPSTETTTATLPSSPSDSSIASTNPHLETDTVPTTYGIPPSSPISVVEEASKTKQLKAHNGARKQVSHNKQQHN